MTDCQRTNIFFVKMAITRVLRDYILSKMYNTYRIFTDFSKLGILHLRFFQQLNMKLSINEGKNVWRWRCDVHIPNY